MDFKQKAESRYNKKIQDKKNRFANKQMRKIANESPYFPSKKSYDNSSSISRDYYYKQDGIEYKKIWLRMTDKGVNKGKTIGNTKHFNKHYAKQMIIFPERKLK